MSAIFLAFTLGLSKIIWWGLLIFTGVYASLERLKRTWSIVGACTAAFKFSKLSKNGVIDGSDVP